jgi:(R,R)-butanediol dehydrogenase / meso-butanediol dehydrogenase / diacetyl reductase
MKALRWYGKKDLRYEDAAEPIPGPGSVKVKISFAGICGSELKEYLNGPHKLAVDKLPLTAGHEFSGRVADIGDGVINFQVGDRVAGVGNRVCGNCFFCQNGKPNLCLNSSFSGVDVDGCMAEYMISSSSSLYKLPDSVSDEVGALVEPLAVAIHAIRRGKVNPGDTVTIVGDGTIGLCSLLAARAAGALATYVVAKHPGRGRVAEKLGATRVFYIQDGDVVRRIKNLTGGLGTDVSLECVGQTDALELGVKLVRKGGIVVAVGVIDSPGLFPFGNIVFEEKTIIGSSIYTNEAVAAIGMMADKRIDPTSLITSIVPLKNAVEKGFERLLFDKEENIKILLQMM